MPPYSDGVAPLKLSAIQSSATTYLGMDAGVYILRYNVALNASSKNSYVPGFGNAGGPGGCDLNTDATPEWQSDCESGRHFGGVNIMFADGHAKWLKTETVIAEARKYNATNHPPSAWDPLSN